MMSSLSSKVRHEVLRANGRHPSEPEPMSPTNITNCWCQPGTISNVKGDAFHLQHLISYKYLMKILLDCSAEGNKRTA